MKSKLSLIAAVLLCGCATASAPTPSIVKFDTVPSGADLQLVSMGQTMECQTPCSLAVVPAEVRDLSVSLEGYVPFKSASPFARDLFTDALVEAMTGSKMSAKAPSVLTIQLVTPEERELNREKAAQKKSALEERREGPAICLEGAETDPKAQPLVRVPPRIPKGAKKSGHCTAVFNVNPYGVPTDVETPFCSDPMFSDTTILSVQKWKFNPKIMNSEPVSRCGVETKVSYRLMDNRGKMIPE